MVSRFRTVATMAAAAAIVWAQSIAAGYAQEAPRDNIIDGTLYPEGFTPVEIRNGKYPRVYFPNTEKLGANEMRVTALGTGMPNVITGKQKASGWYVELGNGEVFMFDLGSGTMENLAKLRPDWSKGRQGIRQPPAFRPCRRLRRTLYRRLDERSLYAFAVLWAVR